MKQPEEISYEQFQLFMVNTFIHQLHVWITSDESTPHHLNPRFASHYNAVRTAVRGYAKLFPHNSEEDFFQVGDEFQQIMAFIQEKAKQDPVEGFSLLHAVKMLASQDEATVTELWKMIGQMLSRLRIKPKQQ